METHEFIKTSVDWTVMVLLRSNTRVVNLFKTVAARSIFRQRRRELYTSAEDGDPAMNPTSRIDIRCVSTGGRFATRLVVDVVSRNTRV